MHDIILHTIHVLISEMLFTGLVFSDLGDNSTCDSLSPFYTLWDTEYTGNLIGFGLLSFGYDPLPNSKTVDEYTLKVVYELRLLKQLGATSCKPRVPIPTPLGVFLPHHHLDSN